MGCKHRSHRTNTRYLFGAVLRQEAVKSAKKEQSPLSRRLLVGSREPLFHLFLNNYLTLIFFNT
jgi:hypothetical protein